MEDLFDVRMWLSCASFLVTAYFWMVKSRKERPNLEFYQLSDYRLACRRHPSSEGMKRVCLLQLETGGVLIVNHSTRQTSIVLFDCFLCTNGGEIQGEWGYSGDDKPPWNVGPESTIAFSPACFFNVPEEFEVPENPEFRMQFLTANGAQFSHRFTKQAPRLQVSRRQPAQAA